MPSTCPKCHQVIEDDSVCCADVRYTWKCRSCGKLSSGFVIPYGRCFLCGGENQVIAGYAGADRLQAAIVQEAMQYEIDMYQFYRLGMQRTDDKQLKAVLEELYHKEEDHLNELEQKYHVHLESDVRQLPGKAGRVVAEWIFQGIDFADRKEHVPAVYEKAISMERRTRDHFRLRAETFPPGPEREVYRELAAEEDEHVSILETEFSQITRE